MRCHCPGASRWRRRSSARMTPHSSGSLAGVEVGHLAGPLELEALVHEQRRVAAVVDDQVRAPAVGPDQRLVGAPPVLLERLALPGEDGGAVGALDACRRRPTATAAAAGSWVLKMLHDTQRTSAPRSTSVSISTAVCTVMCSEPMMRAPGERLRRGVAGAQRHQARHLLLGEADLLAAELGEREVLHLEGQALGAGATALSVAVLLIVHSPRFGAVRGTGLWWWRRALAANSGGPLASGAGGSGWTRTCSKPAAASQSLICSGSKPEPDVSHLLAVLLAVVAQHVDDQQPPARPQRARRLAQHRAPARRRGAAPGTRRRRRARRRRSAAARARPAAPRRRRSAPGAGAPPSAWRASCRPRSPGRRTARRSRRSGRCRSRGRRRPSRRRAARPAPRGRSGRRTSRGGGDPTGRRRRRRTPASGSGAAPGSRPGADRRARRRASARSARAAAPTAGAPAARAPRRRGGRGGWCPPGRAVTQLVGEQLQVAADRRLRQLQHGAQLGDRQLGLLDHAQDARPRRVGQRRHPAQQGGGCSAFIRKSGLTDSTSRCRRSRPIVLQGAPIWHAAPDRARRLGDPGVLGSEVSRVRIRNGCPRPRRPQDRPAPSARARARTCLGTWR